MKLREDINMREFFQCIVQCEGEVLLKSAEGDILNLKSALSQFVFAVILENKKKLKGMKITLEDENDRSIIERFLETESVSGEDEDGKK